MLNDHVQEYFQKGNFKLFLDKLDKSVLQEDKLPLEFIVTKAQSLATLGRFTEAINVLDTELQSEFPSNMKGQHILLLSMKAHYYTRIYQIDIAKGILKYIYQRIKGNSFLKIELYKILIHYFQAYACIDFMNQQYTKGIANLQEALKFSMCLPELYSKIIIYFEIIDMCIKVGDLIIVEEYIRELQTLIEGVDNDYYNVLLNYTLSLLYRSKRRYIKAIVYAQKAIKLTNKIDIPQITNKINLNIGIIHRVFGNKVKAENYLLLCHRFFKNEKLIIEEARCYYELAHLYINLDMKKSLNYINNLKLLMKETTHNQIKSIWKMGEVLYLLTSPNFSDKARADKLLKELINLEYKELAMEALFMKCDLLILEFATFKEDRSIAELYDILDIIEFYDTQNKITGNYMRPIFNARIEVIRGDFLKALQVLNKLRKDIDEIDICFFKLQVNLEIVLIRKELVKLKKKYDYNKWLFNKYKDIENIEKLPLILDNEFPILLLVINNAGITIMKYEFTNDLQMQSELLGTLISALNSFASEVFGIDGSLDQITYQGFNITQLNSGNFCSIYISIGDNPFVKEKLEKFNNILYKKNISKVVDDVFLYETETPKDIEEEIIKIFSDLE